MAVEIRKREVELEGRGREKEGGKDDQPEKEKLLSVFSLIRFWNPSLSRKP